MAMGLLGRKIGMTRVFNENGVSIPVTVIGITPNSVTQIKTLETDGYSAVQLASGKRKLNRVAQPQVGHFAKAQVEPGDHMAEFRVDATDAYVLGQVVPLEEVFKVGQLVDVSGTSKGKGFSGAVRRHNFRTQDATHGNSVSHRAPGSIGQNQSPGRVFKGKKMAGQYGNKHMTVPCLEVVQVRADKGLLLVKGGIPGAPGSKVTVKPAVKASERSE